ncbi:neuronal PAS domain-containing protein 4A-like [Salmo salar]|uniref:Neuronal PAS domain-containing protein 4A-like n=1 Tax=Salmo salar TaxID=8030 RepID=A0A1S3L172_SALSA|nr:neuronal PAS domain-containing protein 4A-like [Salmo salar]|eukprot:XP_013984697.1 PREDICTED: neuronal PAS domain-containing protein 4-like [Salmo salar]
MYRSTKGASKARRDQINAEIRNIKELLPISDSDKARLSYLHIMSLACMYTRKSVFFSQAALQDETTDVMLFQELSGLMHELFGFMILLTSDGKLLYLSDNVADHLGHCMVDLVAQSDSVYDIIDPMDHFVIRSNLVPPFSPPTDKLFRCRFNTTKFIRRQGAENKLMLVRARCLTPPCPVSAYWTSNPVWVCFCTPLKTKTPYLTIAKSAPLTPPPEQSFLLACFHSQHHRDMRLWDAQDSVSVYLGYDVEFLRSRSWYSLVHPRDLSHASTQHCLLLSEGEGRQVDMVVQVEAADHSWVWLYMVLQLNIDENPISCHNYIISESEACSIRQQSSCEEPMQPVGYGPRSSLSSLDEENFPQAHGGQLQWEPKTSLLSVGPTTVYPPASLTDTKSDVLTQRIPSHLTNMSEALPSSLIKPLAPLTMPHPQQIGECACTPPYTPHLASGSFPFVEKLQLSFDPFNAAVSCPVAHEVINSAHSAPAFSQVLSSEHPQVLFPAEPHGKLPPTTNSFVGDECSIMGLPQISGPLYVDVPHRPFHGPLNELLLTPEASPTHPPCSFFSTEKEQEREREDISLLAKYISSLAEGFYCDPLLPRVTPPTFSSSPSLQATSQNPSPPCGAECPPWRGLDPPLSREDISLYEESMALESLIEELSTFPLSPSSCSSPPSSSFKSFPPCWPLIPVSRCKPSLFKGESSIGVNHFCSVQSTQCNYLAVGGAMMAVGAGIKRDMEESSESEMDTDVSVEPLLSLPSSAIALTAFQECAPAFVHPAPTIGLPHAQSLLEELDTMESVFEADASFNPSRGDNLSCINSHSTIHSQSFHQDGNLRDPLLK